MASDLPTDGSQDHPTSVVPSYDGDAEPSAETQLALPAASEAPPRPRRHWSRHQLLTVAQLTVGGFSPAEIGAKFGCDAASIRSLYKRDDVAEFIETERTKLTNIATRMHATMARSGDLILTKFISRALDDDDPKSFEAGKFILTTLLPTRTAPMGDQHVTNHVEFNQQTVNLIGNFATRLDRLFALRDASPDDPALADPARFTHSAADLRTQDTDEPTGPVPNPDEESEAAELAAPDPPPEAPPAHGQPDSY